MRIRGNLTALSFLHRPAGSVYVMDSSVVGTYGLAVFSHDSFTLGTFAGWNFTDIGASYP